MMQQQDQPSSTAISSVLTLVGGTLVVIGVIFLLGLSATIYDLITAPDSSPVYKFVTSSVVSTDQMISGKIDGKEFEIRMNEDLRNFSFIFMSIFVASILFGIINSLILTGATLLKQAKSAAIAETSRPSRQ